ncbi:MAG: redoxin domain-containing protein [Clostridium sp.]|uniref:redoxin domain-containing protein n=1 Tax=Negativibacillus massiliensis TaxID=1871035 RepID=UPI0023FA195C|nr:redoxin domain-containing protein [Negativibacillus massiliensis]MBS5137896.1 redoxin domain-containing protein [Clostridium sp.]
MLKKLTVFIIAAAMALSLFGCGQSSEEKTTEQSTEQTQEEAPSETPAEETVEEQPEDTEEQPENAEEQPEDTEEQSAEQSTEEGAFEKMSLTNLAGDEIDKTIFEGHDLTVINVWATSCKPCLSEMPELAKLSDEYEQNGGQVQIIGLCTDLVDMDANRVDSQIELANQIVELTGADYTHLVPDDEMLNFLMENIIGVPTTFFVDSQGKEVGESVIGARDQAAWQEEINNRLAMLEK